MAKKNVKSPGEKASKDEIFWSVLNAAIELDYKKGHGKWTISDLARKSGITRSLIYYYFGQSKESIMQEAVKIIGEEMVGMSAERQALWQRGELIESMLQARRIYEKCPALGPFVLEHYSRTTEIGAMIRKLEKEFCKKIKATFPTLDDGQVRALYAVYWGLSFSPLVDDTVIRHALTAVKDYLKILQGQEIT
ncbi:MAG: TetR/AcrR family transcriptional regulator [Bdellovibrionales bacterium]|nr:TetR/AcrR family transcriptional regulator [Bdellovibrionales bacterium]